MEFLVRLERNGSGVGRVQYEEFAPCGVAARYVESYWRFTPGIDLKAQSQHRIMPDGLVSISAVLSDNGVLAVMIVGPSEEAQVVPLQPGVRHAGLRLRPGAAKALFGIEPRAIVGCIVPMQIACAIHLPWAETVFSRSFEADCAAHFDRAVDRLAGEAGPIDAIAAVAANMLMTSGGQAPIAGLAAASGLSDRQFRSRFYAAAGLSPKAFAMVRRHREAWVSLANGETETLAAASNAGGFADQPHFSRETKRAFSTSPSVVRKYIDAISHKFR